MKIEIVANVSVNGQMLLEKEHAKVLYGPSELINLSIVKAVKSKAAIVGRTTYEMFGPSVQKMGLDIEFVVLTSHPIEGVKTVTSVKEAVTYLERKGYERATVGGGVSVWDAFLKENLVDDIFFNVFPVVTSGGGVISTADGITQNYKLVDAKNTLGILSLHYTKA